MKTIAVYRQTGDGLVRWGTFTPRKHYSTRAIADQFRAKHPEVQGPLFMARRYQLGDQVVEDGQRIPLE